MTAPADIPAARLKKGDFLATIEENDLVLFVLNVGDGDTQLILLPVEEGQPRRALIVDVATVGKLEALVDSLIGRGVLEERPGLFPVVVGTHPHADHIAGMPAFLERFADVIDEYWEPGYFHTILAYGGTMNFLEDHPEIRHTQPTSGMTRYIGGVRVMALSPAIGLRNRFDSYGIDINDSSISLRVEFPMKRLLYVGKERQYIPVKTQAVVLGADAHTLSWAQVISDFPELHPVESPVAKALELAQGADALRARVLKVSHHGSKHGINLELVERIAPSVSIVSSEEGSDHGFPHLLAQEALREARSPIAKSGKDVRDEPDHELGIHYTGGRDSDGKALGSVAVALRQTGFLRTWRFGDVPTESVDLDAGRIYR